MNHDMVVGLCSKIFMRLFYYIHLGFGKSMRLTLGSNRGPSDYEPSSLPLDQKVNCYLLNFLESTQNVALFPTAAEGGGGGVI